MPDIKDFGRLVRQMRAAQKRYFADRTPQNLRESKDLERRVDAALSEMADQRGASLYEDRDHA